jgi:hypothetical protein
MAGGRRGEGQHEIIRPGRRRGAPGPAAPGPRWSCCDRPGPDPPGPAPLGLPGPRALLRLAGPDRGLCSAWPAPGPALTGRNGRARCHMPAPPRSQADGGSSGAGQASPLGCPNPGRLSWAPKARLPSAVTGDGRAPPVTAAGPPTSFHKSRTCLIPGLHTPRRCPGGSTHLSPPELRPIGERMEFMWRIPRHRDGAFPAGRAHGHRSYRGS